MTFTIMNRIYNYHIGFDSCKEEEACTTKDVRQGCSLSPCIFHLYIQKTIDKATE